MSTSFESTFTREQLFADLQQDGITINSDTIKKAKDGDGDSIYNIGYEYSNKKQQYDKAMAWYRLAAIKNYSWAQNNIGTLYHNGKGVASNYSLAMKWYLKSSLQNNKTAWGNIGIIFENGRGVPVDKYKALEWYYKSGEKPDKVRNLTEQGIQITEQDKNKPIEQLIMETEDIFWTVRRNTENKLTEKNKTLHQLKTKMEEDASAKDNKIKFLAEEIQNIRNILMSKQEEIDSKQASIEHYKKEIQMAIEEVQSLKQASDTQTNQLKEEDSKDDELRNETTSLSISSEDMTKKIEELGRSNRNLKKLNQNLKRLLEQERRLKDNKITLIKQEMQILLNKEKEETYKSKLW